MSITQSYDELEDELRLLVRRGVLTEEHKAKTLLHFKSKHNQERVGVISETIDLLGLTVRDKVTGFEGVISSVSFDLYGCVQCVVTPSMKEDGTLGEARWFDVHRLDVMPKDRAMDVPDFSAIARKPSEFSHGPAEKPARS